MIKVKLSQVYNNQPYYSITQNESTHYAFGAEQAAKVVKGMRKAREKVSVESIASLMEEHNKLIKLLKS